MIVKARQLAGFDARYMPGLGLPRPADRERDREDVRPQPAARRGAGEEPRLRRPSRSPSRWPTSSAWACWATGTIRTGRWTSATRPARSARFKRVIERGFVYRGLKPVYWCFDCGSSLAEFEIEYADKKSHDASTSPSCAAEPRQARRRLRPGRRSTKDALRRHLDHDAVDHPGQPGAQPQPRARLRAGRHRARPARPGERAGREVPGALRPRQARCSRRVTGERLDGLRLPPSAGRRRPGLRPRRAGLPRRLRDRRRRHRHRPLVAGLRRGRLQLAASRTAWRYDDILNPVQGNGVYDADAAAVRRPCTSGRRMPRSSTRCATPAACSPPRRIAHSYPHCWRHKTPVIYRAAAQWFVRMDERRRACSPRTRRRRRCARCALDAIDADQLLSRERPGAPARHDRQPARLVHQPPAQLGRAAAVLPAQGLAASCTRDTLELLDRAADDRRARRHRGLEPRSTAEDVLGAASDAPRTTPRATTSSTSGSTPARRFFHVLRGSHPGTTARRRRQAPRPTSTSKATTSTAAGSTRRC